MDVPFPQNGQDLLTGSQKGEKAFRVCLIFEGGRIKAKKPTLPFRGDTGSLLRETTLGNKAVEVVRFLEVLLAAFISIQGT